MEKPVKAEIKEAPRKSNGQLLPGARLNPNGRPVGSYGGLRAAQQILFDVVSRNQDLIRRALQEEARKNPARFARQFILPTVPHKFRKRLREQIRTCEMVVTVT